MPACRIAGIELGGTKSLAVLGEPGRIDARLVVPTTTPDDTLGKLREQLLIWHLEAPLEAVGIASFGPVQLHPSAPDFGRILATPKHGWSGTDVVGSIMADISCPSHLDTDVNAAALAEHLWGRGSDCDCVCYLTIGTGVGAGIVVRGEPIHGALHPEVGHVRLRRAPGDSFEGICPFHGDCVEGLVSGPAIATRRGGATGSISDEDPLWRIVAHDLAELAGFLLLATSAQRLLFGGGVCEARPHLLELVRSGVLERLAGYLPFVDSATVELIIATPALGADAGPMGSLALATRLIARSSAGA